LPAVTYARNQQPRRTTPQFRVLWIFGPNNSGRDAGLERIHRSIYRGKDFNNVIDRKARRDLTIAVQTEGSEWQTKGTRSIMNYDARIGKDSEAYLLVPALIRAILRF